MKKIFLIFAAVCAIVACDPTHEDIGNASHITADQLKSMFSITVDKAPSGANGNVITCQTSAPVNAKWNIGGKEFIGNYAWKKMKLGSHKVILTALCPDGTVLMDSATVECQEITNALQKYYIFGTAANPEHVPFKPAAWEAADMRFSDSEGRHLPTIPDDVYFGLKTLIFDVSDVTEDFDLKVMNGWWSNTYYDHVKWHDGLNELQITETLAKECAKGGEGRDLDLMLYSGSMTLNSVYYEE